MCSAAGATASRFYAIYLSKDAAAFRTTLALAAAFYAIAAALHASSVVVSRLLSVRWRGALTRALHTHYFHDATFYHLSHTPRAGAPAPSDDDPASPRAYSMSLRSAAAGGRVPASNQHAGCALPRGDTPLDNPDQRVTDDVRFFCDALATFLLRSAEAPITFFYYSYLTFRLFGTVLPIAAAVAFFVACAAAHRVVVGVLAAAVCRQERAEGDFRSAHVRIRDEAGAIAAWGGGGVERAWVARALDTVLRRQTRLAWCYAAQDLLAMVRCTPAACHAAREHSISTSVTMRAARAASRCSVQGGGPARKCLRKLDTTAQRACSSVTTAVSSSTTPSSATLCGTPRSRAAASPAPPQAASALQAFT